MKGTMHVTKKGREQLARMKKGKKIKEELAEIEAEEKMPDIETRLLRLENVSRVGEALVYKIKKLEDRMDKLELIIAFQTRNPAAQPKDYRSGEWHRRSGNVYQDVALPGSPNAQEAKTTAAPSGKTPDDQGGDLPPSQ